MSERFLMLLHYLTGLGILVAGSIHLGTVFLTAPVEENLEFANSPFSVINVYRSEVLAISLEALLIFVAFHAFNGLRIILIELYQSPRWERFVNWSLTLLALLLVIYGTRTLLIAYTIAKL